MCIGDHNKWAKIMAYKIIVPEPLEKEISRHYRERKQQLDKFKEKLEHDPTSGKPLSGKLHGIWQLRMGPFRILYEINEKENIVVLRAIEHKDSVIKKY